MPWRRSTLLSWNTAFYASLLAILGLVFALPVFPSQDGPVHLYYVDVLHDLLTHAGRYGTYFQIRTLVSPYATHYYLLLAFETVFSPVMSEKLFIALYVVVFCFSFRFLVESIGGRSSVWSLAGMPFCLHQQVYQGFFNFCLGVSLALLLSGVWFRWHSRWNRRRVALLLGGFVLLLLTHPVPAAVYLVVIGLHFLLCVASDAGVWSWRSCAAAIRKNGVSTALVLSSGIVAIAWVGAFMTFHPAGPPLKEVPLSLGMLLRKAHGELTFWPIAPILSWSYRAGLVMLLTAAGAFLAMAVGRHGGKLKDRAPAAVMAASAVCFVLGVVAPDHTNGSSYFSARFPIFWILFLFASLSAVNPSRPWKAIIGGVALTVTLSTLWFQWQACAWIEPRLREILSAPPAAPNSAGFILADGVAAPGPTDLAFSPFMWTGAHYFRRSHAVILNAPWARIPIQPIKTARLEPWQDLDPFPETEYITQVERRGQAAPTMNLVVRTGPETPSRPSEHIAFEHGLSLTWHNDVLAVYSAPHK